MVEAKIARKNDQIWQVKRSASETSVGFEVACRTEQKPVTEMQLAESQGYFIESASVSCQTPCQRKCCQLNAKAKSKLFS